jgi:hypothetical protein
VLEDSLVKFAILEGLVLKVSKYVRRLDLILTSGKIYQQIVFERVTDPPQKNLFDKIMKIFYVLNLIF